MASGSDSVIDLLRAALESGIVRLAIRTANGSPDTWSPVGTSATSQSIPVFSASSSNGGATSYTSTTLNATLQQIRPATGTNLYALLGANGSAAAAYIQIFTTTALASVTLGTTVPDFLLVVPAGDSRPLTIGLPGVIITEGIVAASTTAALGSTGSAAGVYLTAVTA